MQLPEPSDSPGSTACTCTSSGPSRVVPCSARRSSAAGCSPSTCFKRPPQPRSRREEMPHDHRRRPSWRARAGSGGGAGVARDSRERCPPLPGSHEPMGYQIDETTQRWTEELRQARWLCLSWPTRYGGRNLRPAEVIAVNEEFARAGVTRPRLGMGENLVAPAILAHGTAEQQERLLPRIMSGEDVYCQGFSEPEAGSDLASLRTRGVVDGDNVVVDGEKIWQSGAHRATMIFTLCLTDPDAPRHQGMSYVLVPMADNGVQVEQIRMMTGDHGFNQVRLAGARAPMINVIGGFSNGWKVAMTALGANEPARRRPSTGVSAGAYRAGRGVGTAPAGCRPAARQAGRGLHAGGAHAGRRATDRRLAAGRPPGRGAARVDKVNWSEYHVWFGEMAVEELGLEGLLLPAGPGYPLTAFQRVLLESRGRRIARGTNQIQRNIIAERLLGLPPMTDECVETVYGDRHGRDRAQPSRAAQRTDPDVDGGASARVRRLGLWRPRRRGGAAAWRRGLLLLGAGPEGDRHRGVSDPAVGRRACGPCRGGRPRRGGADGRGDQRRSGAGAGRRPPDRGRGVVSAGEGGRDGDDSAGERRLVGPPLPRIGGAAGRAVVPAVLRSPAPADGGRVGRRRRRRRARARASSDVRPGPRLSPTRCTAHEARAAGGARGDRIESRSRCCCARACGWGEPHDRSTPPLEGIRVADFGQFIAGPAVGEILAEMGARVVKVEPPSGGEVSRTAGSYGEAMVRTHNRDKLGLAVDLRHPGGVGGGRAARERERRGHPEYASWDDGTPGAGARSCERAQPSSLSISPSRPSAAMRLLLVPASTSPPRPRAASCRSPARRTASPNGSASRSWMPRPPTRLPTLFSPRWCAVSAPGREPSSTPRCWRWPCTCKDRTGQRHVRYRTGAQA